MSIQLRSRRGPIGTTWQGIALRTAMESSMTAQRAATGRRIARGGLVEWLDVVPGLARARVGTADASAEPAIHLAPLPAGDRAALVSVASAHPDLPARLAAGELPVLVERELEAHEVSLLPRSVTELWHDCSCEDWPGPCEHVAALTYVLVEALDEEPVHLLTLRGLSLADLAPRNPPGASSEPAAHPRAPDRSREEPEVFAPPPSPRVDLRRGDPALLADALGQDVADVLARFFQLSPRDAAWDQAAPGEDDQADHADPTAVGGEDPPADAGS